jgi:hypothetical protein
MILCQDVITHDAIYQWSYELYVLPAIGDRMNYLTSHPQEKCDMLPSISGHYKVFNIT